MAKSCQLYTFLEFNFFPKNKTKKVILKSCLKFVSQYIHTVMEDNFCTFLGSSIILFIFLENLYRNNIFHFSFRSCEKNFRNNLLALKLSKDSYFISKSIKIWRIWNGMTGVQATFNINKPNSWLFRFCSAQH